MVGLARFPRFIMGMIGLLFFSTLGEAFPISKKTDKIFIGSSSDATDVDLLYEYGITHVLNCAGQLDGYSNPEDERFGITRHDLGSFKDQTSPIDTHSSDIAQYFDTTHDFLENLESKVLVHCQCGVSRSASIVIAHLIKKNNWDYDKAYRFVRRHRKIIGPNRGFVEQLRRYAGETTFSSKSGFVASLKVADKNLKMTPDSLGESEGDGSDFLF